MLSNHSASEDDFTIVDQPMDVSDTPAEVNQIPPDPIRLSDELHIRRRLEIVPVAHAPATEVRTSATLEGSIEQGAVSHKEDKTCLAMFSLQAAEALTEADARPDMDLVICMDKSGSMRGDKIRLVKQTLQSLITKTGLGVQDRVSLVSFDTDVKVEMPLANMDANGRKFAEDVVRDLTVGTTTNLSGGLLQSIDILNTNPAPQAQAQAAAGEHATNTRQRTRLVLLFTDGIANHGITDPAQLNLAVKNSIQGTSTKVFTFGFGSDHNENMLRGIATEASGLYYFIKSVDDIGTAFADCLGGVMSVVAQNATLTLGTLGGDMSLGHFGTLGGEATCKLGRILGNLNVGEHQPGAMNATISLGDLYSGDAKDVLFELQLPATSNPVDEPYPVLQATLRFFSVLNSRFEEVSAEIKVSRPIETPIDQPKNMKLDEQHNRLAAADAMENASRLADAGELEQGRSLLERCLRAIEASDSTDTTLSSGLKMQIAELTSQFETHAVYRSIGSKMSKMHAMSHQAQRSNHASEDLYGGGKARKAAMRASWGISK